MTANQVVLMISQIGLWTNFVKLINANATNFNRTSYFSIENLDYNPSFFDAKNNPSDR